MKDLITQAVVLLFVALLVVASKDVKAERDDNLTKLIEQLEWEQEVETFAVSEQEPIEYELIYEDTLVKEYYFEGETIRIYESNWHFNRI